jgi:hypothetical protein
MIRVLAEIDGWVAGNYRVSTLADLREKLLVAVANMARGLQAPGVQRLRRPAAAGAGAGTATATAPLVNLTSSGTCTDLLACLHSQDVELKRQVAHNVHSTLTQESILVTTVLMRL